MSNTCPICLEPLTSAPMGAIHPCGHVIHVECWDSWTASRQGHGQHAHCVMCNKPAPCYSRIFLDFTELDDDDDEDNDDSEQETTSADLPEGDVVVVTVKPLSSSSDAALLSEKQRKLKNKERSKRLRLRNKSLQSRLREKNEENQSLHQKLKEVDRLRKEIEVIQDELGSVEGMLDTADLQVTRLTREKKESESKLRVAESEVVQLRCRLSVLKDQQMAELKKARTTQIAEMQQILAQQPKLKQANRELLAQIHRLQTKLQEHQKVPVCSSSKGKMPHARKRAVKDSRPCRGDTQKKARQILREIEISASLPPASPENGLREERADCIKQSSRFTDINRKLTLTRMVTKRKDPLDELCLKKQKTRR